MADAAPAPDVVGLTEAAAVLGIRPARVRGVLRAAGAKHRELAAGAVWSGEAVRALADDSSADLSKYPAPSVLGAQEAAELLGMLKSNLRKWTARRQLQPAELAFGPVWHKAAVERERRRWKRATARA